LALLVGFGATSLAAQARVIAGSVTDGVTGEPVVGAEVTVPNTNIRTFVADDGTFSLGIPTGTVQILIRRIGYKRYLLTVGPGQNAVEAQLERDVLQLEEVVVTGVATGVSRLNLANAIGTVSGEQVNEVSSQSVEHALQGKVAGVDIQQNSGAPGGGVQVRLRGTTSINATAQPLWVVDGVLMSDVAIPSNQNAVTASTGGNNPSLTQEGQVNRIADLNPEDIESIEVLKGASASAIYGSKASNGVIIITTKRGRAGAPRFNISQRFGFFDLSNKLGSRTFEDAAELDGLFGAGTAAAVGFTPGVQFDHEEQLAGRNSLSSETSFNLSGGDEDTQYFMSGLWQDDAGIMENTGFAKQSLRFNLDQTVGERIRGSLSANILHSLAQRGLQNNDNAGVSPYMVFPFTANVVDLSRRPDGTFPENPFERSNPLQTLGLMQNDEDVWRFTSSGRLEFTAARTEEHELRFIGLAGADFFRQQNELFFPPELQFEDDDGFPGTALLGDSDNLNINVSGSAVYTFAPASGSATFTTSGGLGYETRDLNITRVTSRGLTAGQPNIDAGTNVSVNEDRRRVEDFGFYLQEEVLLLENRLLLTAGFHADQSSANADDTKLHFYPKFSGSYRIPVGGVVDNFKFRLAYGESGNLPLFGQKFTPLDVTFNVEGIPGIIVPPNVNFAIVGSDELKPERQREIEGGIDASLYGGRATVEFSVYQKTISDLLLTRRLPPTSGFGNEIFNGGELRTRGAEFSVGVVPAQSADLNWVFRTNFFLSRSTVTDLPVPSFIPSSAGFGIGLGAIRIEQDQSPTQIVGNTGIDSDGNPIEAKVGDVNPDFKWSFANDVTYKNVNLYFLFDWQKGSSALNLTQLLYDIGRMSADFETPGPDGAGIGETRRANGPLVGAGDTRVYVQDLSFLKLREVTLSWRLPEQAVSSIWGALRNVRLYMQARNLITVADYPGVDPEVSNFGNQPTGRNIDVAPFPPSRSFWFGLDLGF
jgi:TonB-linked SusC/RagA family outer membrane protein